MIRCSKPRKKELISEKRCWWRVWFTRSCDWRFGLVWFIDLCVFFLTRSCRVKILYAGLSIVTSSTAVNGANRSIKQIISWKMVRTATTCSLTLPRLVEASRGKSTGQTGRYNVLVCWYARSARFISSPLDLAPKQNGRFSRIYHLSHPREQSVHNDIPDGWRDWDTHSFQLSRGAETRDPS